MEGNRTCDSCKKYSAEVFCACTAARIYLCTGCIGDHTVKYPGLMHQLISADIEVSDLAAYRQRNDGFAAGSAELEQNLTRIDQCCQEVTAAFDAVIEYLGQWRDCHVRSLQELKATLSAEIAEAENEVKSTLAQDSVQLSGKYSVFLRNYQPEALQLFTYEIDTSCFDNLAGRVVEFHTDTKMREFDEPRLKVFRTQITSSSQPLRKADTHRQKCDEDEQEALRLKELAKSKLDSGHHAEAIDLCAAADSIYSGFADTIDKAINLTCWGLALKETGNNEEALAKYAAADSILSRHFKDTIDHAINLYDWASALLSMKKYAEAVAKFSKADVTLSRFFPDSSYYSNNLGGWALALDAMGKSAMAVAKYAEADTINSRFFPNTDTNAINLWNWGLALNKMGKKAEAVRKFKAARLIYASMGKADSVRECDQQVAQLR